MAKKCLWNTEGVCKESVVVVVDVLWLLLLVIYTLLYIGVVFVCLFFLTSIISIFIIIIYDIPFFLFFSFLLLFLHRVLFSSPCLILNFSSPSLLFLPRST